MGILGCCSYIHKFSSATEDSFFLFFFNLLVYYFSIFCIFTDVPYIAPEDLKQQKDFKQNVLFDCRAQGVPPENLQWYFNANPIKSSNRCVLTKKISCLLLPKYYMVRLQSWNFAEYGVPLHCHYSWVRSNPNPKKGWSSPIWNYY